MILLIIILLLAIATWGTAEYLYQDREPPKPPVTKAGAAYLKHFNDN